VVKKSLSLCARGVLRLSSPTIAREYSTEAEPEEGEDNSLHVLLLPTLAADARGLYMALLQSAHACYGGLYMSANLSCTLATSS
jgi:hypothetical protein